MHEKIHGQSERCDNFQNDEHSMLAESFAGILKFRARPKFCVHSPERRALSAILKNNITQQTMKKIVLFLLIVIKLSNAFGQTDKHGNPIFNSEPISEENFDIFELTSSYYTINNNISNKGSSVYVSDKPTSAEYLKFARELPSNFFIVHRGESVMVMIMLMQKIKGSNTNLFYNIVNPNNGKIAQIPCTVFGEISEKRADELLKIEVDMAAKIIGLPNNGKGLLFNGIVYRIQPYERLKAEVIAIAKQLLEPEEKIKDPIKWRKNKNI